MQAKKVANHLKKHNGGHGYTDQDNPFGDSKVNERFVWGKKIEKQIQSGVNLKDLTAKAEKRKQEERLVLFTLPHCMLYGIVVSCLHTIWLVNQMQDGEALPFPCQI